MKVVAVMTSLGERTTDYAAYLTKKQVNEIHIVSGITPLKKASIACLETALEAKADYFLMNDADCFIKPGIVKKLAHKLRKSKRPMITGHCKSKFFEIRQGGVRLFNCKYLPKMIKYLKEDDSVRPIASIHLKFNGLLVTDVTCLHEYEQYYKDIYSRFVVQSIRSTRPRHKELIRKFKKSKDKDLLVAYAGYFDKEKDFNKSFPDIKEKDEFSIKNGIKLYGR